VTRRRGPAGPEGGGLHLLRKALRRGGVRARFWSRRVVDRVTAGRARDVRAGSATRFVRAAYQIMLRRDADPAGLRNYVDHLHVGRLTPDGVLDEMLTSMELRAIPFQNRLRSLHQSRCDFVRLLPRARRILDLGGTDQESDFGALVTMGYPYRFEQLLVVDLPAEERHALYAYLSSSDTIETPNGPVQYRYHSMVDLSQYPDGSFDLVFSGETIEHITGDDARKMLSEVHRVLAPGGWFCLDTPNRRATELMMGPGRLSNPDHELEYTDAELRALLGDAGFEIVGAYGLNHLDDCFERGAWDDAVAAARHGVYADVENCQLLAYVCRRP
jgi:SAM-dependent methyltransferase